MEHQYILERLDSLDEKFDSKLDAILIQTTKTNGRVNGLEAWKETISKALWWALGVIVTVGGFLFQHWISKK